MLQPEITYDMQASNNFNQPNPQNTFLLLYITKSTPHTFIEVITEYPSTPRVDFFLKPSEHPE